MTNKEAMDYFIKQIDKLIGDMKGGIPGSQSHDNNYLSDGGKQWTDGFWCGMLNLAYEYTGDDKYKNAALAQVDTLYDRIVNKEAVNHHDMGFLYSPSCIAAYELYGNEKAKKAAILAADNLVGRFRPLGNFIQAWGEIDDNPAGYRLIIDCLLNLPLLYRVSLLTGDNKYRDVAQKHFYTAIKHVIRDDYSTNHTFFFDINSGEPLRAETVQGYANDSMWARGQAWAIYGLALNYRYLRDDSILKKYNGVVDAFIKNLPADYIPYWDMLFREGDEPRDTSAAAIAICGIIEMNKMCPSERYMNIALKMLESMVQKYTTKGCENVNGIITDSMYNRNAGHKPECSIWGDYYAMEAIYRILNPDWKLYW